MRCIQSKIAAKDIHCMRKVCMGERERKLISGFAYKRNRNDELSTLTLTESKRNKLRYLISTVVNLDSDSGMISFLYILFVGEALSAITVVDDCSLMGLSNGDNHN